MKLASLKHGRDGKLIVVDKHLKKYVEADGIGTMQRALEDWDHHGPELRKLAGDLEAGHIENAKPFNVDDCASPLPRAYQICDGSAYLNHVELVRKARGAEMPPEFLNDPLMYRSLSEVRLKSLMNRLGSWAPLLGMPANWLKELSMKVVSSVPLGFSLASPKRRTSSNSWNRPAT